MNKKIFLASSLWIGLPKIELDLYRRPGPRLMEVVAGLVLVLAIGYGISQYWGLHKKNTSIQANIAELEAAKRLRYSKPVTLNEAEAASLANAYNKLNYAWDRPFKTLEQARTQDISILEVAPNIDKQEFEVVAQSTSLQSMLEYTKKLRELPFVRRVVLNNKESQEDEHQPVLFRFTLAWY